MLYSFLKMQAAEGNTFPRYWQSLQYGAGKSVVTWLAAAVVAMETGTDVPALASASGSAATGAVVLLPWSRSTCPRSRPGSMTFRTRRFSSFVSGNPPSALRSHNRCTPDSPEAAAASAVSVMVTVKTPPVAGCKATSPSAGPNVDKSSWANWCKYFVSWRCRQKFGRGKEHDMYVHMLRGASTCTAIQLSTCTLNSKFCSLTGRAGLSVSLLFLT